MVLIEQPFWSALLTTTFSKSFGFEVRLEKNWAMYFSKLSAVTVIFLRPGNSEQMPFMHSIEEEFVGSISRHSMEYFSGREIDTISLFFLLSLILRESALALQVSRKFKEKDERSVWSEPTSITVDSC